MKEIYNGTMATFRDDMQENIVQPTDFLKLQIKAQLTH